MSGSSFKERCRIAVPPASNEPRINDRIRAREVLLVDADGNKQGVVALAQALDRAREQDLDLVEVAPNANPPVCRIMDYGRYRFDATQRAKESKRKGSQVTIKEMKYRVKIGKGDFDTKTRKVLEFLEAGHKVKLTIMFRGRETDHAELGKDILDRVAERAGEIAKVEAYPRLDGRNMTMVLAPDKRVQQAARATAKHAEGNGRAEPATAPSDESGETRAHNDEADTATEVDTDSKEA